MFSLAIRWLIIGQTFFLFEVWLPFETWEIFKLRIFLLTKISRRLPLIKFRVIGTQALKREAVDKRVETGRNNW